MQRKCATCVILGMAFLAVCVSLLITTTVCAADHRDGPRVTNSASTLGALDINDFYLFVSPQNRNNTVMIMTTGGAAVGILSPPVFFPGGIYEFRLSNDGNPVTDEIVAQVVFSDPDRFMRQAYVVFATDVRTGRSQHLATGVTGRPVNLRGGGKVQAGLFDDPFFFDLIAFNKFKEAVMEGLPLADRVAPFLPPNIPNNFFGNFNVLAIVIEVPRMRIQSSARNTKISAWVRSLTPDGTQFDRMGRPAINTAVGFAQPLQGLPNIQDTFNSLTPAADAGLIPAAAQRINLAFGLPLDQATSLSRILLPDVMTFDTTDKSGFLNGRRLPDDVIDAELGLLTGGALTSDRVINDSVFSNGFPYIGAALPRTSTRAAIESISNLPEARP